MKTPKEIVMIDFNIKPRWCPGCKQNRVARSFYTDKKTGSPIGYCKPCVKLRNKAYYEKRKKPLKPKTRQVAPWDGTYAKCSSCGISKPTTEFYKDKTTKRGFRLDCIECLREVRKMRYEYKNKRMREQRAESLKADLLWNGFMPDSILHSD